MINDNVFSSVNIEINYWMHKDATYRCVTMGTIAACATGIFASAYLAYQHPGYWTLTTLSVVAINLYTLPKILHYGNLMMVKLALIATFLMSSTLLLGGTSIATLYLSQLAVSSLGSYQVSYFLFTLFLLTALLGYGIPLYTEQLKKACHLLLSDRLKERLSYIQKQFQNREEKENLSQISVWESFILHLTLLKPQFVLAFYQASHFPFPDYAWPMATIASQTIELEQFDKMLCNMEKFADDLWQKGRQLSDEMQENYYFGIKLACQLLPPAQVLDAVSLLTLHGSKLVPNVLSNTQFLQLFTDEILDATNDSIQTFLDLIHLWQDFNSRYQELDLESTQLEQELTNIQQELTSDEKEYYEEYYQKLHEQYSDLRTQIQKIYAIKRNWQGCALLWDDENILPFDQRSALLNILHDQNLLKSIEQMHHSLIATGNGNYLNLNDRLQWIRSKLAALDEDKEESEIVSATMYLAMTQSFVQKDYHDLQEWLNVDSLHDIEKAMTEIGLATEEDLYDNDILLRQAQTTKGEIRYYLRNYIQNKRKFNAIGLIKKDQVIKKLSIRQRIEKITRAAFYIITSSLILFPTFIQPNGSISYLGSVGFIVGLCFSTLKRFGCPGTQTIADWSHDYLEDFFLLKLLHRPTFSYPPQRREEANQFIQANLFERIRIINKQIFIAYFSCYFGIGKPIQSVVMANEIVHLV